MEDYKTFLEEIEIPINMGLLTYNQITSPVAPNFKTVGMLSISDVYIHRSKVVNFHEHLTRTYPQALFTIHWAIEKESTNLLDPWASPFNHRIGYVFGNHKK